MTGPDASYYAEQQARAAPNDIRWRFRPRDIGGILDQAFRLYRKNFLPFLAVIAIIHIPVQVFLETAAFTLTEALIGLGLVYSTINFLRSTLNEVLLYPCNAALTTMVKDRYIDKPISFGEAYRQVLGRLGPLLGLMGLQLLIRLGIIALMVLPIAVTGRGSLACLSLLVFIPALFLYIFVYVRLRFAVPALMVENLGPRQAVERSLDLVKGYGSRTFWFVAALGALEILIAVGPVALVTWLANRFAGGLDPVTNTVITSGVTIVTTMLYIPVELTAVTLYYLDLRVRKESFDLEAAVFRAYPSQATAALYGSTPASSVPHSVREYTNLPDSPAQSAHAYRYAEYGPYRRPSRLRRVKWDK